MDRFIGLDVSLARTTVCRLNAHGNAVNQMTVASEPEALAGFLRGLCGSVIAVGLEAGGPGVMSHGEV